MTRRHLIVLVAITLLTAILRFYQLDSLPPGLFGDEALVTLHARTAVATGQFPIYFAQWDGGFHPAVVYATIVARWLTNAHPYAVRFAMAFIGVVNIPLFYWALKEIFRLDFEEQLSLRLALLGAFIYTVTFPVMLINRVGFEASVSVTTVLMMFLFLAQAIRSGRRLYFILAGVALGLSLYAYYFARLLPFTIALVIAWLWATSKHRDWKQSAANLSWVAVASLIVFAPLGYYFFQNPEVFFARATTTSVHILGAGWAALPLNLLNSTLRTIASLSINGFGDFIPRHNLPYRAVFDPAQSVFFWIGLFYALRTIRARSTAVLLTWLGTMLLPAILTMNLDHPHYTRMMGAFPALVALATLGAYTFFKTISTHNQRWAVALTSLSLAFSLIVTSHDYFVRWATDPALFDAFQVGGWRAASLGLEKTNTGIVLLSPEVLDDPSDAAFNVLLRGTSARQFPGPDCLVYFDQPTQPITYISSTLHDPRTFDRVHALFLSGQEGATIIHEPDPWPLYQVFEVPVGAAATPPQHIIEANFGNQIELIGYDLATTQYRPGETIHLTFYWRAQTAPNGDYNAFIHLYQPNDVGDLGAPIAQTDGAPCGGKYVTSRWAASEIVIDEHTLSLPADLETGSLKLAVGLYGWPTLERLSVMASDAILPDNRFLLTTLTITP